MNIDKLDCITLEDGEYTVLEILPYNENEYYCLAKLNEDGEPTSEIRMMFLATCNGNVGLSDVKDITELNEIKNLFQPMLEIDYGESNE